jgi:hypothetical protein
MTAMLYKLGRFLQLSALIILPVAITGNVAEKLSLAESLVLSSAGVGLFILGWLLQQGSRPR